MGQRICFYKINSPFTLKEWICEEFNVFRNWYLDIYVSGENRDEYILCKYLTKIINFKKEFNELSNELLNEIMAEFIGVYCDLTQTKKIELMEPFMNKRRYDKSTKLILNTSDKELICLWKIIINGRSIKDGKCFKSFTNDYKVGYLSSNECKKLEEKIKQYFGNINADTLTEENEGIVYALQAINEMQGKDMVIGIE
ncbi:MAG: hypothetical protein LBJ88_01150 [Campylobacteraceae bacterium]|jgi:hypothetical protein|nr:hypothetical protein [Campylobacteraceae bacterium]